VTVVDLHRHLWPEPLLDELRARSAPPCLRGWTLRLHDGDYPIDRDQYGPRRCLEELDRNCVELAVISCPPTLGVERLPPDEGAPLVEAYHDGMRAATAESGGRLLAFAMGQIEPGFVGATVPAAALLDLDAAAPLLDELERERRILFVHPGVPAASRSRPVWWPAVVDYTAQMQAAYAAWLAEGLDRWPDLRVLFAILAGGAPIQLERLFSRGFEVRRALAPTLYLDTASYGRRALELCLATYGGERLVFGSDGPVIETRLSLDPIRGFGQAVTEALCRDNPKELLQCR